MIHAAKVENRHELLDKLEAKQTGMDYPLIHQMDALINIYDEEERNLGYNIADYYLFSKNQYQLPLTKRAFIWGLLAICSGIISFYVPFFSYGYGVAN